MYEAVVWLGIGFVSGAFIMLCIVKLKEKVNGK